MYTRDSPIAAPSDVTADELAAAWMAAGAPESERANVKRAATAAVRYSDETGIDPLLMGAVGWIETGEKGTGRPFRSSWWKNGFNFGNLGITGDDDQNAAAQTWDTPYDGAAAAVAHMVAYRYGDDWREYWNDEFEAPAILDKRFELAIANTPKRKGVKTFGELNRRWAIDVDDDYGGKLADRANKLRATITKIRANNGGNPPMVSYDYSRGKKPPTVSYPVAENKKYAGYINPADHWVGIFFIHSAYGLLEGTADYMAAGNALTDAMVGNGADGAALDGTVYEFNNPYGNRFCHASGPVVNPIEDAAKFLELFGPDKGVINSHGTALERSNYANRSGPVVSEKEHRARVMRIAWHANIYGKYLFDTTGEHQFTCDTFPLIPAQNNRSFLAYHGEANEGKRETCPDPAVRATLNRIIADVRVVLSEWQKGTGEIPPVTEEPMPTYPPVKIIDALQAYKDKDAAPAFVKVGADTFVLVNDRVRATKATPRYRTADVDAAAKDNRIGPDITAGSEFAVLWLFEDEDGRAWYITPYWTRVLVADTKRISDAA